MTCFSVLRTAAGLWARAGGTGSASATTTESRDVNRFAIPRDFPPLGHPMSIQKDMSTTTSLSGIFRTRPAPSPTRVLSAVEVPLVYGAILLYIWSWQYSYPKFWMPLLALVLLSHAVHRDSPGKLGLSGHGLRSSAQRVLPLALLIFVPALLYSLASGRVVWTAPGLSALRYFGGYLVWCAFQQYLAQSFFHNRLMEISENRHLSSSLVALMFGAAHIPNPILMPVTALGGFLLAEIFARHRNIWPLALVQAVGGVLVAALAPASLLHNMRVGPGYFFFGIG